jgi:zinc and cadmium transporter
LVAFAVGALIGDVFIHLLPELAEEGLSVEISLFIILGIVVFFALERVIHWHHHHKISHEHCESFSYMILVGDALHNFLDGMMLAGAFLTSPLLGISTTIAIFMHEVPQEFGDFAVLIKGKMIPKKALFYNFVSSLTAFLGAIVVLLIQGIINSFSSYISAFTIGSFLYIAGTDLLPELHKTKQAKKSVLYILFLLLGVGIMYSLTLLE